MEQRLGDDGLMCARKALSIESDFAGINGIAEDGTEGRLDPRAVGPGAPVPARQFRSEAGQRRVFGKPVKDELDTGCLGFMFHEVLVVVAVAVGNHAAIPHTFFGALVHLIAGAVSGHFPFKLCEVEEDVAQKPSHGVLGVEALGDRDEFDVVLVEDVHEQVKILHSARQAVDLVGEHTVDLAGLHVCQHLFKRGPVERFGGIGAVLVHAVDGVIVLAAAVRFQAFPLGLEGAIVGVQLVPAGNAGVQGANGRFYVHGTTGVSKNAFWSVFIRRCFMPLRTTTKAK